jgi:iron(III) transport system permease protein
MFLFSGGAVRSARTLTRATVLLLAVIFCAWVAYPLAMMVLESFPGTAGGALGLYATLFDPSNAAQREAIGNSVIVSALSVVFSGVLGLLLAFTFTQCHFRYRSVLARVAVLPVALPPLVGVIAFLFAFGESGIIPRGLHLLTGADPAVIGLRGLAGVVVIHAYSFHVYFYLFCSSALRELDASLLDAAAGMGAGAWRTFRRIVLPELRPALVGASALTFMASMASFTAPLLFAGDRRFLALQIYQTKLNGDLDLAAAQSVLLTLVSLFLYLLLQSVLPAGGSRRGGKGAVRTGTLHVPRGARRTLVWSALALLTLEALPVLVIFLLSFAREGSWTTQWLPASYSVENYLAIVADPKVLAPVVNSILLAALTVAAALLFGVPAAYMTTKGSHRKAGRLMQSVLTIPYAVPGTVVGIAMILAFNTPSFASGGAILVGTFWILPLAYFFREYPLVIRSTMAALEGVDDVLLEAAGGLGASPWRRFRTVVLPLIFPGIIAGAVLVAIGALGEFVSSVLLYTYASRPIAVEIFSQLRLFNIGAAAAYSVVLMIIIFLLLGASRATGADWAATPR